MKQTRFVTYALANLFLSSTVLAQATFALQNRFPVYAIDAPVFDAQGMPLAGANFRAELWGAATPDALVPAVDLSRNQTRVMVPFLGNGYFLSTSGFIAVPSTVIGGGGYAWLQVRAWDARLGPTYEDVAVLGLGGYGESPLFYARGGNPFLIPAELPGPLIGLQSFSLRAVIPEPST
jgi:hypothetical protein